MKFRGFTNGYVDDWLFSISQMGIINVNPDGPGLRVGPDVKGGRMSISRERLLAEAEATGLGAGMMEKGTD
jgi:hypothetical protein